MRKIYALFLTHKWKICWQWKKIYVYLTPLTTTNDPSPYPFSQAQHPLILLQLGIMSV